ncbi:sensor histidine kinase [Kineosporia mesophila]|uniref:sensor histidine kinase n=1 Tax=Kineosporia mesophila TaxID=566012 RepID=UPI001E3A256E|nr:ATP-binding protein [Kineosporia mesophila]MCD5354133.1 ATP-binding protein [Kineosporia mesophila]
MVQRTLPARRGIVRTGRPGVQAAVALTLARAVLVLRLVGCLMAALAGLATVGPQAWARFLLPLALVLAITLVQERVLDRLGPGRPRVALIAADTVIGLGVLLLGIGDPVCLIYQAGTSALAGALLGRMATPVWIGQALLAAATEGVVLGENAASPAGAAFVLVVPMLVFLAGAGAGGAGGPLLTRLQNELEDEREQDETPTADRVRNLLRSASLSVVRASARPGLADRLARLLVDDASTARQLARTPVRGLRFDDPRTDFADLVGRMSREWAAGRPIRVRTELTPIAPSPPVRHALAVILDEALENVLRHAHATRAGLELRGQGQHLELTIQDNGRGFAVPSHDEVLYTGRYEGLRLMTAHATGIGATLTVTSEPYSGTTISVRLPA